MVVAIIVINVLVFFWELSLSPGELDAAIEMLGFVPRRFFGWEQAGGAPLDPWRFLPLLTANFLHGGWFHIVGNMWFLWVFGDNVEDVMGPIRFAFFYVLCGLAAAFAQVSRIRSFRAATIICERIFRSSITSRRQKCWFHRFQGARRIGR